MNILKFGLIAGVFTLISTTLQAQAVVNSDFATNADGWTAISTSLTYSTIGGNPTGHVFAQSPGSVVGGAGVIWQPIYFVAPAKFTGNKSTYYGGGISFDVSQTSTAALIQYPTVIITDVTGISLYYFPNTSFAPPTNGAYTTISVPLSANSGEWKTTNLSTGTAASAAQIQSTLTSLNSVWIQGLYRNANLVGHIDNVNLRPPLTVGTQPTSTSACQGLTATFTAVGTNNPTITYHWQNYSPFSGGTDLTASATFINVTSSTLSVNTTALTAGTYNFRARISGIGGPVDIFSSVVTLTVNATPTAPTTAGANRCGAGSVTFSAAGGTAGSYRWYTQAVSGTAISGETAAAYVTPSLSTTTNYWVAINNGTCESARTIVTATVNITTAPTVTNGARCGSGSVTLNAAGGTNGQYKWYTTAVGSVVIPGETNSAYTTPSLTGATNYWVSITVAGCESTRTMVTATINTIPTDPTTTGGTRCGTGTVVLSANGGTSGQYRWYDNTGALITGQTGSLFTTPSLSTTTNCEVSINNGSCESNKITVTATITPAPAAPATIGATACVSSSVTLTASGGSSGQYTWYTTNAGNSVAPGSSNDNTYNTPQISSTTTYYVSITSAGCESNRTAVTATIGGASCNNAPPEIDPADGKTFVGGKVIISLTNILSDPDGNLDLSTLTIVSQPSSGATVTIDFAGGNLIIDYHGRSFVGTENITISVCDTFGACTQQQLSIEVDASMQSVIYNAVSPKQDGKNDIFYIENIDQVDETKNNRVMIFNRWGELVWEGQNYDNTNVVFRGISKSGAELVSGTYYYKLDFPSRKSETGFLVLKR